MFLGRFCPATLQFELCEEWQMVRGNECAAAPVKRKPFQPQSWIEINAVQVEDRQAVAAGALRIENAVGAASRIGECPSPWKLAFLLRLVRCSPRCPLYLHWSPLCLRTLWSSYSLGLLWYCFIEAIAFTGSASKQEMTLARRKV